MRSNTHQMMEDLRRWVRDTKIGNEWYRAERQETRPPCLDGSAYAGVEDVGLR